MKIYQNNIRRLGQFVEAFEQMVHEVRSACEFLLDPELKRQSAVSAAFHHSVMTAKPLFDIMRAVVAETLKNTKMRAKHEIDEAAENIFHGVLQTIGNEYNNLTNTRNNLLHGTWFMGFGSVIEPGSDFLVYKMSVSKTGIAPMELPKNTEELLALAARCRKTGAWIGAITVAFIHGPAGNLIKATFRHDRENWIRRGPAGDETLP